MKIVFVLLLLTCSCAGTAYNKAQSPTSISHKANIQGFLGVLSLEEQDYQVDPVFADDVGSDLDKLPTLGFALQKPLGGERIQLGIEGGMSAAWERDTAAFDTGGGVIVVGDNDLFLSEAFIGVYASILLGQKARIYAGAGPMLQYASAELEFEDGGTLEQLEESGVGGGAYARIGIEYEFSPGSSAGFFIRHVEATVDLDGDIGDVDLEGTHIVFAVTTSF